MKFDFVIGNPPYQDEVKAETGATGEKKKTLPSIYNHFMDSAYQIADKALLIHPARFLYNAGNTPKAWNQKILNDSSFKIVHHEPASENIFQDQSIMGGIAISYRDKNSNFGAIKKYARHGEIKSIIEKVIDGAFISFSRIVFPQGLYRFSEKMYREHPDLMKKFADARITSGAFARIPQMFVEKRPDNGHSSFLGLLKAKRVWRWFRNDYFNHVEGFAKYKVVIPKANGSPALGEGKKTRIIGPPLIGKPFQAHTQSFLSIGNFENADDAAACLKYIKSRFCRTMLGMLKITQNNPPYIWDNVPMQDFSANSDMDWSKSIAEIDRQLYAKYGLDDMEIKFIEANVETMG